MQRFGDHEAPWRGPDRTGGLDEAQPQYEVVVGDRSSDEHRGRRRGGGKFRGRRLRCGGSRPDHIRVHDHDPCRTGDRCVGQPLHGRYHDRQRVRDRARRIRRVQRPRGHCDRNRQPFRRCDRCVRQRLRGRSRDWHKRRDGRRDRHRLPRPLPFTSFYSHRPHEPHRHRREFSRTFVRICLRGPERHPVRPAVRP